MYDMHINKYAHFPPIHFISILFCQNFHQSPNFIPPLSTPFPLSPLNHLPQIPPPPLAMSNKFHPGSRPPPLIPLFCPYCHNLGIKSDDHSRHNCPRIAQLPPCQTCGQVGTFGHTQTHCPHNIPCQLKLRKSFKGMCGNFDEQKLPASNGNPNRNNSTSSSSGHSTNGSN